MASTSSSQTQLTASLLPPRRSTTHSSLLEAWRRQQGRAEAPMSQHFVPESPPPSPSSREPSHHTDKPDVFSLILQHSTPYPLSISPDSSQKRPTIPTHCLSAYLDRQDAGIPPQNSSRSHQSLGSRPTSPVPERDRPLSRSSEPNIVRDRTPEYDAPLLNGAGVVRVPPSNEIPDSSTSNSDMEFSDDATSRSHSPLKFAPSFLQETDPALVMQGYAWCSLMHPPFPNEVMPGRYRVISLGSPFVNWSDVANTSQSAPRLNGTAFSPSPHPDLPEPADVPRRLDHPVYASPFPQPPLRQDQVNGIDFHAFSNERRPSPIDSTRSEDDSVSRNIANDPHGISFTIQSSTTLNSPFRYETQRRLQDPQSIDSHAQQILLDEYI
ncbi:hypothetical protein HGRIS_012015 [Hohenbuehelia grisea]|uniref:Uncharacterized protein n=1 Tax=Hohenbuehelia grisea TaxID=104357 RepID=A0ABR3IP42_9AGAR